MRLKRDELAIASPTSTLRHKFSNPVRGVRRGSQIYADVY